MIEEAPRPARDIHLLTTEILLAELVGGRSIALEESEELAMADADARAVLDWYRLNKDKWTSRLSADDAEAVVGKIATGAPELAAAEEAEGHAVGRRLRLVKVEAHRFAGLHMFGTSPQPPETFVFEPAKAVTLFEGSNGSGKTSIVNSIVWCLTGELIRSQRMPASGLEEFTCEVSDGDGALSTHKMSPVTPMPGRNSGLVASGKPVPADTWVELTFTDEAGNVLPPVRRTQSRNDRGKLLEDAPDLSALGLDPIAWRIGTTMPAILPYLAVGSASQLGQAAARLTGLADLSDLAEHAGRMGKRFRTDLIKSANEALAAIILRFGETSEDLTRELGASPDLAFEGEIPAVSEVICPLRLDEIERHFTQRKAAGLGAAQKVLGEDFNPEDQASRDNLERSIHPAIVQLKQSGQLPSISRLSGLTLSDGVAARTRALLGKIASEGALLANLAESPERARREQLYARVASWVHEHGYEDEARCPVCVGDLALARDPVTDVPVAQHLVSAANDRDVVSRTIAQWVTHWTGELLSELPAAIAAEARRDLPASPADLLAHGMTVELFGSEAFRGALGALRADAEALVDEQARLLPPFAAVATTSLPAAISGAAAQLETMIGRVERALAFAAWRDRHKDAILAFIAAVRRGHEGSADAERAVGKRLDILLGIVESVAPLNRASVLVNRLADTRKSYENAARRKEHCVRAESALLKLTPLGGLAQQQVDGLRERLHARSEFWRKAVYRNANTTAPELAGTAMSRTGVLELTVGREGVTAPAQHISNASALRGALFGFYLAFREHVLDQRGGIETLVLDDPQELLDNENRERLARGISRISGAGAQVIVTTHDGKFARCLVAEHRATDGAEHFSVHPVNPARPRLVPCPAIEEVDRKRDAFRETPDDHIAARDYAAHVRVFLEARLGDLFDDVAHPAHGQPSRTLTLLQLMDRLRGLSTAEGASELFRHPVVLRFLNHAALAEGAEPRRVLNEAHHGSQTISYADVEAVQGELHGLRTAIEKVHEQFRLYRWRDPLEPTEGAAAVVSLPVMRKPAFSVPVCPDIAAFAGSAPAGGSQDEAEETLGGEWFEGKALYHVSGETLGFAVPAGSIAIVEAEPYAGRDRNLVIARHRGQVLARRLVKPNRSIGVSLAAQVPDPRTSRPALTFDSGVRLYRIVGALFTYAPPPGGSGEAQPVEASPELEEVAVAYRVKEDSAIPLALPDQIILGGKQLTPADLDHWEDRLVAVTLDDGTSIFKRVGRRLPGRLAHLRQFETIGGRGSSLVVATEVVEGDQRDLGVPLMTSARRVIGVLYE